MRPDDLEHITGNSNTGGSMTEREYASNQSKVIDSRHNSYIQ